MLNKDLIIVGAGGLGREALQWIKDANSQNQKWNILGFLDRPDAMDGIPCSHPILGTDETWDVQSDQTYVLAIARPKLKETVAKKFKAKKATFETIIHPEACISDFSMLGEGIILYPGAYISPNVTIGAFTMVQDSTIGHDAKIGSFCSISSFCNIMGGAEIGNRVFVGSHAAIIPGVRIGDDAYIGVGSIVLKDVPAGAHVFGNPARIVSRE